CPDRHRARRELGRALESHPRRAGQRYPAPAAAEGAAGPGHSTERGAAGGTDFSYFRRRHQPIARIAPAPRSERVDGSGIAAVLACASWTAARTPIRAVRTVARFIVPSPTLQIGPCRPGRALRVPG